MTGAGAEAGRAVEQVARTSRAHLLGHLAAGVRDLAAAEDALAEAFVAALRPGRRRGSPSGRRPGC